ncbi:uncharacterized protein [Dysidea avara]|uniref:uncharacterized protein n=1 Tax=Dysidea avara TaxID=196820 RepID=UPI003330D2E0
MAEKVIAKGTTLSEDVIDVITYWFGANYWIKIQEDTFSYYDELWRKKWFSKEKDQVETDSYIKEHFSKTVELALQGEYTETWCGEHHSCLALIILLDQFTRNIYRNNMKAWSGDKLALQICLEAIDKGMDKKLSLFARCQFYMPLIHAENMEIQERCLALYKEIVQESPPSVVEISKRFQQVSLRHYNTIATFGRYPERNKLLQRPSTRQEAIYLSA